MASYIIDHSSQVQPQSSDWTGLIRGLRFINNGRYVCGYVDSSQDLIQLLDTYRSATGTSFTSNQNLVQAMKTIDENQLQMRFMSPASRPRLFWQMNAGEPTIQYDGVPFMSIGHGTDLPCARFGGRRKKIEQVSLPSGDVVPVDYRAKTGCEAKITIRQILRYPCAEYSESMTQGIAAVRRHRKQILDDLVERITQGTAKAQERFHFLLPTPMAHNGHAVADIDNPLPVAQQVLEEIVTQLSNGITGIIQLRDRIKNFVITTYGTEATLHANDPMYCPSEFEIFRQVYWLYKLGQVIDQDSTFKNSMGLSSMDQALAQTVTRRNASMDRKTPVASVAASTASSDAITSVYSIIMDDGPSEGSGPSLEQLSGHHISTQEVELNSGDNSAQSLGGMDQSAMVNQIQMGINSSPITIPQSGLLGGSGHHTHLIKQPLLQNNPMSVKVAASKPVTTNTSNFFRRNLSVSPSQEYEVED